MITNVVKSVRDFHNMDAALAKIFFLGWKWLCKQIRFFAQYLCII